MQYMKKVHSNTLKNISGIQSLTEIEDSTSILTQEQNRPLLISVHYSYIAQMKEGCIISKVFEFRKHSRLLPLGLGVCCKTLIFTITAKCFSVKGTFQLPKGF